MTLRAQINLDKVSSPRWYRIEVLIPVFAPEDTVLCIMTLYKRIKETNLL